MITSFCPFNLQALVFLRGAGGFLVYVVFVVGYFCFFVYGFFHGLYMLYDGGSSVRQGWVQYRIRRGFLSYYMSGLFFGFEYVTIYYGSVYLGVFVRFAMGVQGLYSSSYA